MKTRIPPTVRVAFFLFAGGLWGCSTSAGKLTLASSRPVDWPTMTLERGVTGKACRHKVLRLIPVGDRTPATQSAIDQAIRSVPEAQLLTDVTLEHHLLDLLVFERRCVHARGTAGRRVRVIHVH